MRRGRLRALFFIHTSLAREFIHPRARVHHGVRAHPRRGRSSGVRTWEARKLNQICFSTRSVYLLQFAPPWTRPKKGLALFLFFFFFFFFSFPFFFPPLFFLSFFSLLSSLSLSPPRERRSRRINFQLNPLAHYAPREQWPLALSLSLSFSLRAQPMDSPRLFSPIFLLRILKGWKWSGRSSRESKFLLLLVIVFL